jgi:hypothetical protein
MRLTVLGCILYRVEFSYNGEAETVLVGGLTNRVFTSRGKATGPTLTRRFSHALGFVVRQLAGVDYKPPVSREYINAVRNDRAHIFDTRMIVPQAAKLLGIEAKVTASGYTLLPKGVGVSGSERLAALEIGQDIDSSRQLVLCTRVRIGRAHRNRFPDALALGQELSFGRIGVAENSETGESFFDFVDCRVYDCLQVRHLAFIIRIVMEELRGLMDRRLLD